MNRIRNIIFILLFLAVPALAHAEVVLKEQTEYYQVDGIGRSEILKSLEERAPHREGNDYFPAYTESRVKYSYSWGRQGQRCAVTKSQVLLTITYTYPKLIHSQSGKTMDWWNGILKRYHIHELVHGDISKRAAAELDAKLKSLRSLSCSTAKNEIQARAQYIMRQMKKHQKEYDRITNHGRQQENWHGYRW